MYRTYGLSRLQAAPARQEPRRRKNIIGTGGPLINNEDPAALLKEALRMGGERDVLLPETAALYADGSYMLYAMGLLACHEPKAALGIMKKSLEALS